MNNVLKKGLQTAFYEDYEAVTPYYNTGFAMTVPSNSASEDYAFLGGLPGLREFRGERVPKRLRDYGYTLRNKEFEGTIEVLVKDIEDDQTGKYETLARSIGSQLATFPDELIFGNLLPNGFTNLAYDGQYFFDTDHSEGSSGNMSNKLTAALSGASGANSFQSAITLMRKIKNDQGRPVNTALDLRLVVPVDLEATADAIVNQQFLSTGVPNPNYNKAQLVVNPWLTDADNWYLINVAGAVKPFIWQERKREPFDSLDQGSETRFMRRRIYFGTYLRGNAGYGLWQKAVGSLV